MLVAWRLLRRGERVVIDSPLALPAARAAAAGLLGSGERPPRRVRGWVRGDRVRLRGVGAVGVGSAFHEPRRTAVLRGRLEATASGSRFVGAWAAGPELWGLLPALPVVLLALLLAVGFAVDVSPAAGLAWLGVVALPLGLVLGVVEARARGERERGAALEARLRERLAGASPGEAGPGSREADRGGA